MSEWNSSEFRKRKAERLNKIKSEWMTAPSGEKYLLRPTGALASLVATQLPTVLASSAVESWRKRGIDVGGENEKSPDAKTSETTDDFGNQVQLIAYVVSQGCVLPRVVAHPQGNEEIGIQELEDEDLLFIFRYCSGQLKTTVELQGGQAVPFNDLSKFRKSPGRLSRVSTDEQKLQRKAK